MAAATEQSSGAAEPTASGAPDPLGSLVRHHDFRSFWIAQTISLLGTQVTLIALPLTAARTLGASEWQMGLLYAAEQAANLLVVLFAGAWVERVRKRPVMIWANLGRAALLATVPLAALLDILGLAQLYAVALLVGLLSVFFAVAYSPHLVALVSRERLVEANGKLELSRSTTALVGPGLAGVLVQVLAAPLALAVDAASFLVSTHFLRRIRTPEPAPERPAERPLLRDEIAEGLRFTLGHPLLRPLTVAAGVFNLFGSLSQAATPDRLLARMRASTNLIILGSLLLGALAGGLLGGTLGLRPAMVVAACGTLLGVLVLVRSPIRTLRELPSPAS